MSEDDGSAAAASAGSGSSSVANRPSDGQTQSGESNDEGTYPEGSSPEELGSEMFKLVSKRATSEQRAEWLRLPLFHAAEEGNLGLVDKLIEAGANYKAGWSSSDGRTLLHAAAAGGNEGVLDSLIKAGAHPDVNVLTSPPESLSALCVAVEYGHEAVARRFITHGADVNFKNPESGFTVLHLAIRGGHEQLAEDLISLGADVLVRTPRRSWSGNMLSLDGRSPLHQAVEKGSGRLVNFLLTKGVEKDEMCDGYTALMLACRVFEPDLAIVEKLLTTGAGDATSSSLHRACQRVHREIVPLLQVLIRWGANVHARDARGHSALHVAAVCNQAGAAVDVLIQAGADIEQKDDDGRTSLSVAVKYGCVKSYLALLRHGASVDAKDNDGRTPMNIACFDKYAGFEVVVDVLLKWGADETIADDEGNTPTSSLDLDSVGYILGEEHSQDEVDRVRLLLQNAPCRLASHASGTRFEARSRLQGGEVRRG